MSKRYFSSSKQEKYCSAGDHIVKLKKFRKSIKGYLGVDMAGYYISHCKDCENRMAKKRQAKNYVRKKKCITK